MSDKITNYCAQNNTQKTNHFWVIILIAIIVYTLFRLYIRINLVWVNHWQKFHHISIIRNLITSKWKTQKKQHPALKIHVVCINKSTYECLALIIVSTTECSQCHELIPTHQMRYHDQMNHEHKMTINKNTKGRWIFEQ